MVRLLGAGAVAGLLVAGIAFPAVGGAGLGIRTVADELNLKPEELKEPPLAEKTTVLDANGKPIAQFYEQYREVVKLSEVADVMKNAIIAIEDERFYEHGAIDLEGTIRALRQEPASGGVSEGGSGITQQLVKQILLNQAETLEEKNKAVEASYARKLNELRYAMAIEQKYTKDQILEKYLNIAYFGAGANGIEAAAKRFFGKPAKDLDLPRRPRWRAPYRTPTAPTPSWARRTGTGCSRGATSCSTRWPSSARSPRRRPRRPRSRSSATRARRCPAGAAPASIRTSASTSGTRS